VRIAGPARRRATSRRGSGNAISTLPGAEKPRRTLTRFRTVSYPHHVLCTDKAALRPMASSDKRKQSLYFPEQMLKEIQEEAARQDRSLSWIVQKAWKIARKDIMKYPSVNELADDAPDDERGRDE
jgi:uncharacterized small protein (TIGR04563 family)